MAEVNTGPSSEGFIFGQNMEERVVKQPSDDEEEGEKTPEEAVSEEGAKDNENGQESRNEPTSGPTSGIAGNTTGSPLLRPTLFKPGGALPRGRLGNNPFVPRAPTAFTGSAGSHNEAGGVLAASKLTPNPFATRPTSHAVSTCNSDSEDEKKDKPLVAPAHFNVTSTTSSTPKIVVTPVKTDDSSPGNKFVLRPSALDRQTANFNKVSSDEAEDGATGPKEVEIKSHESEEGKQRLFGDGASEASKENYFMQFKGSSESEHQEPKDTSAADAKPRSGGSSFVFGQNMDQRATIPLSNAPREAPSNTDSDTNVVFGENVAEKAENLPTATESPPVDNSVKDTPPSEGTSPGLTLAESAAAHQAKLAKREYQEVEVKTGEENESNVFQLNAKLFVFEKDTQSWLERGRGLLRLNDMSNEATNSFQSRLVMRTQGSLRVVLNTKVWASMMVERASSKSIRISAVDVDSEDSAVKVFLIMASPKDADQIFSAIDWRVQQLKMQEQQESESDSRTGSQASAHSEHSQNSTQPEKRHSDTLDETLHVPSKKQRIDPEQRRDINTEESNDSSTLDPETEASNESFSSTVKSSSSE